MIIGDSHAFPMYFGLHEHFVKEKGERLLMLGAPGCLPFRGIESFQKGSAYNCREIMDAMVSRFKTDNEVKTIILVNRGPLYVTGTGYGEGNKHQMQLMQVGSTKISDHNAKTYESALRDTIAEIKSHNKNLILIMSPPELGFEPQESETLSTSGLHRCGLDYSSYLARAKEYRRIINDLSLENPDKND